MIMIMIIIIIIIIIIKICIINNQSWIVLVIVVLAECYQKKSTISTCQLSLTYSFNGAWWIQATFPMTPTTLAGGKRSQSEWSLLTFRFGNAKQTEITEVLPVGKPGNGSAAEGLADSWTLHSSSYETSLLDTGAFWSSHSVAVDLKKNTTNMTHEICWVEFLYNVTQYTTVVGK